MDHAEERPCQPQDALRHQMDEHMRQMHEALVHLQALVARLPTRDAEGSASPQVITLPVPAPLAAAWNALPPAQRSLYTQAIVEGWLEPLARMPAAEPVLLPYFPTGTRLPALQSLSDDALAAIMHHAEHLLEARWPAPSLTEDTAALFETDRQHPETHAALYAHDFYRWCAQTAHLARQGALASVAPQTLAAGMDDAMFHQWSTLEHTLRALLGWLLVWAYAPEGREAHAWWYVRITSYRTDLDILLGRSPVLRHKMAEAREEAYQRACKVAADDLGWGEDVAQFPATCPWTVEQILDDAFWPEANAQDAGAK